MTTKPCPDCQDPIPFLARRHKCGWRQAPTTAGNDTERWRCIHEDGAGRCPNAGSIKPNGPGGFYCSDHPPNLPIMVEGQIAPPPMGFAGLRAMIRPKPVDFEAEAERIALQSE